jgi:hypothetical protein
MLERLIECALRETERGAGDRRAKYIERAHRQLETLSFGAQAMRQRNAAAREGQRSQRMGCDHIDTALDLEPWSACIDDERADSPSGHRTVGSIFLRVRPREDAIEVGDPAVGYPGLFAVQHIRVAVEPGAALNGGGIGPRFGFRKGEGGDCFSSCDARQISPPEFRRTCEGDCAAAQTLHCEDKIREAVVPREGLSDQRQRTNVELRGGRRQLRGCALGGVRHRVSRPAGQPKLAHERAAGSINRGSVFRVRAVRNVRYGPGVQALRKLTMSGLEERPIKEIANAHRGQFPWNCGFCFAAKAWYARRKSSVCMQTA